MAKVGLSRQVLCSAWMLLSVTARMPDSAVLKTGESCLRRPTALWRTAPETGGLRFEIRSYQVEGNTLLPQPDIVRLLAPYTGKLKDFGDVQRALEALQDRYQAAGYAGIQVLLPGDPGMNLRQLPFTPLLTNPASRRGLFFRRGFCCAQGLFTYNHRVNKTR